MCIHWIQSLMRKISNWNINQAIGCFVGVPLLEVDPKYYETLYMKIFDAFTINKSIGVFFISIRHLYVKAHINE